MNPVCTFLTVAVGVFGGCASVPLPREAAAMALTQKSPSSVALYPTKLTVSGDQLFLSGYVRQSGARMTAKSHVDVAFLAAAGREFQTEATAAYPHK